MVLDPCQSSHRQAGRAISSISTPRPITVSPTDASITDGLTETEGHAAVYIELNAGGSKVWFSVRNREDSKVSNGETVGCDADTRAEKTRIDGF